MKYREYRCPCTASVVALTETGRQRAEIVNISTAGARLSGALGLREGASVRLDLTPGVEPMRADVRWVRGALAGLRFARPLDAAVVSRLRGVAGGHQPRRGWTGLAPGTRELR